MYTESLVKLGKVRSEIREIFEINLFAQMELTQIIAKMMIRQKSGIIINMSSILGLDIKEGSCSYGLTKTAIAAWTKTFCILGLLAIVAFLLTFIGTKERVHAVAELNGEMEKITLLEGVKSLFANKYWIMMTCVLALFFLYYAINGGTTVYYAKDILEDKNLVSTINGIYNAIQIVAMFFIAGLVKKYGKRNVFSLGLILAAIGMLILEFGGSTMPVIIISSLIRGIGNACGGATMWAMVSDTIDYGEWKTGHRTEGLVNSACSFGYKIGNGIGSALLGIIIQIGGYVGDATVQSSSALFSIRLCFTWIPLAVFAACFIILRFYHLDDEFEGIISDLHKRAAKNN